MRKRCRRQPVPALPRWLRPRLDREQLLDLGLVHSMNLADMAEGRATAETMWQMAGGVLTWARVAEALGVGQAEMTRQVATMQAVIDRYRRTRRVGFSGLEYVAAREGVAVMDELARLVDRPTAMAAADWSEGVVNDLMAKAAGHWPFPQPGTTTDAPPPWTGQAAPADADVAQMEEARW
jgi:hypothetical protein